MSSVFLISDTHFFHHKILQFEAAARPFSNVEEMNEAIVDNWNRVVTKRDTVWHLGDVIFGGYKNFHILDRLNGNKNLILGNHDKEDVRRYLEKFRKIEACKKYDGYILTHIPIHPGQFYRFAGNVHGHLHSKVVCQHERMSTGGKAIGVPDPRYVNVSCEHIGLTPIAWEDVKRRFK